MAVTVDRTVSTRCPFGVGSRLALLDDWAGVPAGAIGVVCRTYRRPGWPFDGGGVWGVGVLFLCGTYEEFGAQTVEREFVYLGEACDPRLGGYRFESLGRLRHDHRVGLFDAAFVDTDAGVRPF